MQALSRGLRSNSLNKWLIGFVVVWIILGFILWSTGVVAIKGKQMAFVHLKDRELLWWTNMPENYESSRFCGKHFCRFTSDRQYLDEAKVGVFES